MNVEITLTGYGKAAHLVCDNCPIFYYPSGASVESGCGIDHWKSEDTDTGFANPTLGIVQRGPVTELKAADGWYTAYIRPQVCIDEQGE